MDDFGSNGVIIADEIEPGRFIPLGRGNEGLCREQVRLVGKRAALRERKLETGAIVERIAGEGGKARVPHEPGKEDRINDHGSPAHVAWPAAMGSHHLVAVNANGYGLRIAKTRSGRVTACAGVVVVQSGEGIEP